MMRWLRFPRGLRGQLLLLLLTALVAAQGIGAVIFLDERDRVVVFGAAREAGSRAVSLAQELDGAAAEGAERMLRAAQSRSMRFEIVEQAEAERPIWRFSRLSRRLARDLDAPGGELRIGLVDEAPGERMAEHEAHEAHGGREGREWREERRHFLLVATPLKDGRWLSVKARLPRPPLQWAWPALVSVALAAIAVTAVVWITVARIARPMEALVTAADQLGRAEAPKPLPLAGPSEVRRVTTSFNAMADRITRLLDERARTLAAIGHDLRSPITAMRIRLEMVDDAETRERLEACVDEIQSLVEAALALARGGGVEEPKARIDLAALLGTIVAELKEAGGEAALDAPAVLEIEARPAALKRALRNIAENAVRYGEIARIAAERDADSVRITIDDDGPGIPQTERERVFDPFVRLEGSRSRETGGAGLGLAIARAVIDGHDGTIALEAGPSGGTRAVIRLPAARA